MLLWLSDHGAHCQYACNLENEVVVGCQMVPQRWNCRPYTPFGPEQKRRFAAAGGRPAMLGAPAGRVALRAAGRRRRRSCSGWWRCAWPATTATRPTTCCSWRTRLRTACSPCSARSTTRSTRCPTSWPSCRRRPRPSWSQHPALTALPRPRARPCWSQPPLP